MSSDDFMNALPQRKLLTSISVLIVGAGIGGLTCALECWRQGHDVRIIERSPTPLETGDFFTIGQSAIEMFRHWPLLARKNEELAYDPWVCFRKYDGSVIAGPKPLHVVSVDGEGGRPTRVYRHHRPKLGRMLLEEVARIGIEVEFGRKVVEYFEDEEEGKGGVVLADGGKLAADVVVAADGVGTKSGLLVLGQDGQNAKGSGYSIFRTAYPVEYALREESVDKEFPLLEGGTRSALHMFWGPDMHATFWRSQDIFTWTLTHRDQGTGKESWHHTVDPSEALKVIDASPGWPDFVRRAIETTPKDELLDWKLMWRDPQPRWTSPGGRVITLGDAAHTMLPTSGNGGTQAVEDAMSLAACLQIAGKDHVPQATRVHNKLRFERVACCQLLGFINQEKYHHTDFDAVKTQPSKAQASYGKWIWAHDAEAYAVKNYDQASSHLLTGTPFENTNIPLGYVYRPWNIEDLEAEGAFEVEGDWS